VQQYFWKGKHLGLGSNVGYSLYYYNTQIFRDAGVPEPRDDWANPWTWDQFLDAAKRTTTRQSNGEADRFGFTNLTEFHRIMVTNGVRIVDDNETRTMYDTAEAIEVWDLLFDMVYAGEGRYVRQLHREWGDAAGAGEGPAVERHADGEGAEAEEREVDLGWGERVVDRGGEQECGWDVGAVEVPGVAGEWEKVCAGWVCADQVFGAELAGLAAVRSAAEEQETAGGWAEALAAVPEADELGCVQRCHHEGSGVHLEGRTPGPRSSPTYPPSHRSPDGRTPSRD
jgi:hypothetical protein